VIDYFGGDEKFMDVTIQRLNKVAGPLAAELFQKARSMDSSGINANSNKDLHDRIQRKILSSAIYKKRKAFIITRLKQGTDHSGFINIDWDDEKNERELGKAIGGAQLHYDYCRLESSLTLWVIDTWDFRNKSHPWEVLSNKGLLSEFDLDIDLESVHVSGVPDSQNKK
jgi:hypothetical protein